MQLRNLTNVQDTDEPVFADIEGGWRDLLRNACLCLTGKLIRTNKLMFDVDLTIEGARQVDVNPWLREFLKVDAEMGAFSMYSELAAAGKPVRGLRATDPRGSAVLRL